MLITQVGLQFTNSVLKGKEIRRASALMDFHKQTQHELAMALQAKEPEQTPIFPDTQPDPMAISYAGIGRNATLIAYREALARPDDDTDVALANIISRGRRDRGRHFVHSEAQLRELQFAVDMAKNPIRPARSTVEQLAARAPIP
ncbi:hypothetical protein GCM10022212_09040 [Actimicrobium antarcticum]|uniref:Uncharacterized protein n=2 Tax=Actimicrobium antarcticum TaxID=1051899 RepID=A0ABP7STX6_9BURK